MCARARRPPSSDSLGEGERPRAGAHLWLYFHLFLLFQVHASVPLPLVAPGEPFPANVAREGLLSGVSPSVGGEVVAPAEAAQTDAALERLVARVDANVAVEFVRAGEAPVAALHGAGEGLLFGRAVGGGGGLSCPGGFCRTGGVTLGKGIWQQGGVEDGVYGAG